MQFLTILMLVHVINSGNIDCIGKNACKDKKLKCAAGEPCIVNCIGKSSCNDAKINGGSAISMQIICKGKSSCNTKINCDSTDPCTIECYGKPSCEDADIGTATCSGNGCPKNAFTAEPTSEPTHAPTTLPNNCIALDSATWENTNLFNLTYTPGCIPLEWESFFTDTQVKRTILEISDYISQQVNVDDYRIMPLINQTFRALYTTPLSQLKAVIIGQDPAPEYGIATGLAFSISAVYSSTKVPSIHRVLLEVQNSEIPVNVWNGDIESWANNGVLLLNAALTIACESGENWCNIGSHLDLWEDFTELLVNYINSNAEPSVFILWGSFAKGYAQYIDESKHLIREGGHPSPNADGARFFCHNYFNCANKFLVEQNREAINWDLFDSIQDNRVCNWQWHSHNRTSSCFEECTQKSCDGEYSLIDEKVTWDTAKILCNTNFDGIASINSETNQQIVADLCDGNECWIGFRYYVRWGWVWDDYSRVNYINWAPDQPQNVTEPSCAYLMGNEDQQWANNECDNLKFYAVCNGIRIISSPEDGAQMNDRIHKTDSLEQYENSEFDYPKSLIILVGSLFCLGVLCLVSCHLWSKWKHSKNTHIPIDQMQDEETENSNDENEMMPINIVHKM